MYEPVHLASIGEDYRLTLRLAVGRRGEAVWRPNETSDRTLVRHGSAQVPNFRFADGLVPLLALNELDLSIRPDEFDVNAVVA